jgi:hypothetical protein
MITLLNFVVTFLRNSNPLVLSAFTLVTAFLSVWQIFLGMWAAMIARIDLLVVSSLPSSLSFQPLGLINYVFPIVELLNLVVIIAALKTACAGVRIVKSFIPTIA